jgi:hypothetical protein
MRSYWIAGVLAVLSIGLPQGPFFALRGAPIPTLKDSERLEKARVQGFYRMLLRQIKVVKDRETYGNYKNLGYRARPVYAGYKDLPTGWWVYVYPYWYIWEDTTAIQRAKRSWGPEQASGPPDTNGPGDISTAWASKSSDDRAEWLMLEYDQPIKPTAVLVHETYNPGALVRVTAFQLDGKEVDLWKGADPTLVGAGKGVSEIPVKARFETNRIRIYLDSRNVPGWNEIDAVGLKDQDKKIHWAASVAASTTYASPYPEQDRQALIQQQRILELEEEVRKLREEVAALKKMVMEKKGK